MRLSIVTHLTGVLLRVFGLAFTAPLVVALWYGERQDAVGFLLASALSVGIGHLMRQAARESDEDLRRVEALAVVSATWLVVAAAGAIPYLWVGLGPIDAYFESMSGLTTTGATIFTDFAAYGHGIFLWRSLSQWLGGMGVITLFVAVLPRLAIGGRQLFFAETPGPTDEKLTPQVRKTAALLWRVYALFTAAEVLALWLAGMPLFDATCHALTSLSAGGFSPHPESIAGYNSAAVEWIIIFFIFVAGANFALHYRTLRGEGRAFLRDEEFRLYAAIALVAAGLVTLFLWREGGAIGGSVRQALFQVLTILTSTGYASVDFELWSAQTKMVLLVLMFIGGCAGSAAGGPKVVRHLLIARFTLLELKRTLHPRAVLPVKLGGRVVSDEIMRAVLVFFLFYLLVFAVAVMVVTALGADLITGLTAAIAALGNIGPGLAAVGPMENYAWLHPISKIVLIMAMWVGRLEVLTVLAILRPEVWQAARWRRSPAQR
jgi:trk system potassium uptake protein